MQNPKEHWETVYQTRQPDAVSWFQEHATRSLELIRSTGASLQASVIDVGGGASTLVDDLLASGFENVSVLDLSASALEIAHQRLGAAGDSVRWLAGDIRTVNLPEHAYDIWHDRAVFHFLTDPADRAAYVRQVMRSVKPGGHVIVATFAPDGPEQCSGLPVARYAPAELHREFGPSFELLEHMSEEHKTPWGSVQHFVYCHCLKPH
ncbi:MAG TPA: class I SAM-dependent methyltransferase [Acidovorax sp.]|jgi:2-polyprenyl-3-methyl-5-hydroxy-6-metoxy-1,4-benzoquinol methylase|nr:class I SAM-dependent methyltransferase [Acidovorax sp.]